MNPQIRYAQVLAACTAGARWLDIGCGTAPVPRWTGFAAPDLFRAAKLAAGIDPWLPSLKDNVLALKAQADASSLPFADGTFDVVSANMVLEHLADPAAVFREVRRVLVAGGCFLFHTPNVRSYYVRLAQLAPAKARVVAAGVLEGRPPEAVFPTYYRANDVGALERLADGAGFRVAEVERLLSPPLLERVPVLRAVEARLMRWQRPENRPNLLVTLVAV